MNFFDQGDICLGSFRLFHQLNLKMHAFVAWSGKLHKAWCNFVLMRPRVLPDDLEPARLEIRPEAPPGRAESASEASRPNEGADRGDR